MVRRITTEAGIPGIHLCTLNLEKSVQRVISELGWSFPNLSKTASNKLITVNTTVLFHSFYKTDNL